MGKEATCLVHWAEASAQCKVLLEANELIVRGSLKYKVPLASISKIEAKGEALYFHSGADKVALILGPELAQNWARKLTTPPPTLAAKLGITRTTQLSLVGEFSDPELATAIAEAASKESRSPELILAMVKTSADLNYALDLYAALRTQPPIWIVYPKGPHKPIGETEIRNTLRHHGFMDTKVASVSQTLTALRFNRR